jgi:4-carboxymuconolactone decarboxylase
MAAKKLNYRLPVMTEETLDADQRALLESMRAGPRGGRVQLRGPFGVYMLAPKYGELTQRLGAHVRFDTAVEPRLSEFRDPVHRADVARPIRMACPCTDRRKAGVKAETIRDIKAGRVPQKAAKDERAIFDLVQELYKKRRVSERTYKRVHAVLGDRGTVELVGILGYYTGVSMILNVFNVPLPEDAKPYFPEPKLSSFFPPDSPGEGCGGFRLRSDLYTQRCRM